MKAWWSRVGRNAGGRRRSRPVRDRRRRLCGSLPPIPASPSYCVVDVPPIRRYVGVVRGLVLLAAVALTAMLLAGCGGGNDRAKVEISLRDYIAGLTPDQTVLPIGAGPPRVANNSCRDRHVTVKKGQGFFSRTAGVYLPEGTALWSCVVKFRHLAQPVVVGVKGGTKVIWATPGRFEEFELK